MLEKQKKKQIQVTQKQQAGSCNPPPRAILCLVYFYLIEIGSKHAQGCMGMEDIIAFNYFSRIKMDSSSSLEVRQQQSNYSFGAPTQTFKCTIIVISTLE